MPARQSLSHADRGLINCLRQGGTQVTGRQLERWRQAGLLPRPQRRSLGRGRGTTSTYADGAVESAAEIAEVVKRYRSLDQATLALFARGHEVDERALRRAYASRLLRVETQVKTAGDSTDAFDTAEAVAAILIPQLLRTRRGRKWRRRLGGQVESPDSILRSASTNAVLVLLQGEPASEDGLGELLDASGVTAVTRERAGELGPLATEIPRAELRDALSKISLASLQSLALEATIAELEQARDDAHLIVSFASALTAVVRPALELRDAFGFADLAEASEHELSIAHLALPLVAVRRRYGADLDDFLAEIRAELPRSQALARLMEALPAELRRFVGPLGAIELAKRSPSEQDRFTTAVRSHLAAHREDEALILTDG